MEDHIEFRDGRHRPDLVHQGQTALRGSSRPSERPGAAGSGLRDFSPLRNIAGSVDCSLHMQLASRHE